MSQWIWINGDVLPMADAKIDVQDRGFQFADGVYEVIRTYQGRAFTLAEHLNRLASSAEVTFGHVVEAPAARFHKMNEEHGYVDLTHTGREFQVGERVRVIPNHICVAVNLHEQVYGLRGDTVEETWRVDGRGKLQ